MKDLRGREIKFIDGKRILHKPKKKINNCFKLVELFFDKSVGQFIAIEETN